MIHVNVSRDLTQNIESFMMKGHAEFDEPGKDLVCAAASGIVFSMLNAIEMMLDVKFALVQKEGGGYLHVTVPSGLGEAQANKVQLLLEGLITSLKALAFQYGQYIQVHDQTTRRWTE